MVFADCPISQPLYLPQEEVVQFNGFAWSMTTGIIHQSNSQDPGDSSDWITGSD